MNMNKTKKIVTLGVAVALLCAGGWRAGYAAGNHDRDHGHDHDQAEHEEKHDPAGEENHDHDEGGHTHGEGEHEEGAITLNPEQIAAAGIETLPAARGSLAREIVVPGKIATAADRMAHVVPKVGGTVTEIRKNLGDTVGKGETLALIESREMAEAAAEYLAAGRSAELARATFNREKGLWEKKITAEQDYLNAKTAHQESIIRLDLAKQKLRALGHDGDIGQKTDTRFHALRSPIAGRVIGRELTLGEYVDTTRSAFTVADLGALWVETAIPPGDLPFVKEGQVANVTGGGAAAQGTLVFVSPAIDPEIRAAKAIIELDNEDGAWRPGEFASAAIATSAEDANILVPRAAVQSIGGKLAVFVRTDHGFEAREVVIGREDSRQVEVLSGLSPGEPVAVTNTFTLKAELGKAEAAHEH